MHGKMGEKDEGGGIRKPATDISGTKALLLFCASMYRLCDCTVLSMTISACFFSTTALGA